MGGSKLKKFLFIIFILALSLRVFTVVTQKEYEKAPHADAKEYDDIATNIASGHGFTQITDGPKIPTTRRTPLYPLFIAAVYLIFGHSYIAVETAQAIMSALFCVVVFFIANQIYANVRIGLTASVIAALYKPFVSGFHYYGGPAYLLSEYFYMFILGITILSILLFVRKESALYGAIPGFLIGLAVLTRPEFITYPVFLIGYLVWASKQPIKQIFKKYFLMFLFTLLTIAPWTARNYIVSGKFIPLTTLNGQVFLFGNNTMARGGWAFPENYDNLCEQVKKFSEYEQNRIFFKEGINEIKKNPKRIPILFIKKILVHWAPFEKGFEIFNPYYAAILLLGSIGILFFRKRNSMEDILLLIFFTTTAAAVITWGDPRYRYPYEFGLIVFAALPINKLTDIIRKRILAHDGR